MMVFFDQYINGWKQLHKRTGYNKKGKIYSLVNPVTSYTQHKKFEHTSSNCLLNSFVPLQACKITTGVIINKTWTNCGSHSLTINSEHRTMFFTTSIAQIYRHSPFRISESFYVPSLVLGVYPNLRYPAVIMITYMSYRGGWTLKTSLITNPRAKIASKK